MCMIETLESRRLLSAGNLDGAFGHRGVARIEAAGEAQAGETVVVQGDAKVVVVNPESVQRLNADGTDDVGFGEGGVVTQSSIETFDSVALQPDGKILVTGSQTSVVLNQVDWRLLRLNADGSLDTTFGITGIVRAADLAPVPEIEFRDVVVQADGKILVLVGGDVFRLNTDGSVDSSYGSGGKSSYRSGVITGDDDFEPSRLAINSGGSLLVGAQLTTVTTLPGEGGPGEEVTLRQPVVARITTAGALDTDFGDDGAELISTVGGNENSTAGVRDIVPLAGGKFLLSAGQLTGLGAVLSRHNVDGSIDQTFGGGDGIADVSSAQGDLAVDDEGRILVLPVFLQSHNLTGVQRLSSEGMVDDSFGKVVFNHPATQVAVQADGTILTRAGEAIFGLLPAGGADVSQVNLDDFTLTVTGTPRSDRIVGDQFGTFVSVTVNDWGRVFDQGNITLISIVCGDGDDVVVLSDIDSEDALVDAGNGDDRIGSGAGHDTLLGGDGRDQIDGGGAADRIAGGNGRDKLTGGSAGDRINGGAGGDWLAGQGGNDTLMGEGGADYLDGGINADYVQGNSGNDVFVEESDFTVDNLFGDGGHDRATAEEDDILSSIEEIVT
jgi:uncharacterized delta-60 repeat protein